MSGFRLAGLIGNPVAQSRSPKLHGYWLEHYGIAGAYVPMRVEAGRIEDALRGLVALGFAGCNVTIPHKEAVFRLVDRRDPAAEKMGAVNLVVVEADGSLTGYNKDGYGFIENLREGRDWRASAGAAVVLGAGGGARSAVVSLIEAGVPEVRLINRTRERAEALAKAFGGPVTVLDWERRHAALAGAALVVNTTSLGMVGQPGLDLDLTALPVSALVCDIIYNPLETALLAAAKARGNATVNGLGMLIHQARPAFHAWFGVDPKPTAELRAMLEATIK
jgi:shikimate dehydrogenase